PELVYEVQEVIRSLALEETERIILIVTHKMNFAKEIADRIIYMEDGCIVVDEPAREFFSMETNSLRIKRF
ncbi:glutamine ABC transporter ATP-binding protein GlnQ, partial [Lactococcus formosensis]|nr:glutamine ABC transporter ATP-binding protein GlnQ [Lactococcus formosensis]